jgi:Cytidine deaminase
MNMGRLGEAAWGARSKARLYGPTAVGCAALADDGNTYVGCNIEHRYRAHDVHAEVNAISSLVAGGAARLVAIVIAAERSKFTPCGSCMDWIFELGGPGVLVRNETAPGVPGLDLTAAELMPHYPH